MADDASSYPGAADNFTALAALMSSAPKHSDDHKKLRDAVRSIQIELGNNPSDSDTSVRTRFVRIEGEKVDRAGDVMTDTLDIDMTAGSVGLIIQGSGSQAEIAMGDSGGQLLFEIVANLSDTDLKSDNDLAFSSDNVERMRLNSSVLYLGKTSTNLDAVGFEMHATGSTQPGSLRSTIAAAGSMNLYCRHMGASDATTEEFIVFTRSSGATKIGSITQSGTTAVLYNTTSDYRMKDVLGDVETPVERLMLLLPRRLRWKDGGEEFDGFIAHEVAEVVPDAVTGEKDAVYPDDHEHDPGGIAPQQLDATRLVPLLVAAVQELTARVEQLENA